MLLWCSFATDDEFLGVAIVEAENVAQAARAAAQHGCNPGGELLALPIEEGDAEASLPRNRLLSKRDIAAAGIAGMSLGEAEAQGMELGLPPPAERPQEHVQADAEGHDSHGGDLGVGRQPVEQGAEDRDDRGQAEGDAHNAQEGKTP